MTDKILLENLFQTCLGDQQWPILHSVYKRGEVIKNPVPLCNEMFVFEKVKVDCKDKADTSGNSWNRE